MVIVAVEHMYKTSTNELYIGYMYTFVNIVVINNNLA